MLVRISEKIRLFRLFGLQTYSSRCVNKSQRHCHPCPSPALARLRSPHLYTSTSILPKAIRGAGTVRYGTSHFSRKYIVFSAVFAFFQNSASHRIQDEEVEQSSTRVPRAWDEESSSRYAYIITVVATCRCSYSTNIPSNASSVLSVTDSRSA